MVKYGKIEDGVLRSRDVEAYPERYQETKDGVTQVKERIISVAEQNKIQDLKNELASTDYKVIKCYEASLVGEAMPYDTQELHTSRQYIRDSINALEDMLDNIVKDQSGNTGD